VKQNFVVTLVAALALVICGVTWLVMPSIEDPERSVVTQAGEQVERARRLLYKYQFGTERNALLLDDLAQAGVDVEVEDPEELVESSADAYQATHERLWEAFQPMDWGEDPRPARARYGNLGQQVREGLEARSAELEENGQWLDEALQAANEALAISENGASSSAYAEAHRLKGIILYHQGLAARLRALSHRRSGLPYIETLSALGRTATELEASRSLVAESGLDQEIAALEAEADEFASSLAEERKRQAELDRIIADLEDRLTRAEAERDDGRASIDRALSRGIDLADTRSAVSFEQQLRELDRRFRAADREVESLKAGTYANAHIDKTGDLLKGRYLEDGSTEDLSIDYGLLHFRNERDVVAKRIEETERGLEAMRNEEIVRLETLKQSLADEQQAAAKRLADAAAEAIAAYDELNRIESEAYTIEDEGLDALDQSARSSRQAADYARAWVQNAREETSDLSPEAKERSACAKRLEDAWMEGHMIAQVADARLAGAWIQLGRYRAYALTAEVLEAMPASIRPKEADLEDLRSKVTDAHDTGVEAITDAMTQLEKAHREADSHWTFIAQAGAANHLLSLFGHPSYIEDAVAAYRNALKGREDQPYTARIAATLRDLESR